MPRTSNPRASRLDLLARPPATADSTPGGWTRLLVDPVEQLRALDDLRDRGLLTAEEYEQQRTKVLQA